MNESVTYLKHSLSDLYWFQEGPGVRKWQFTTSGVKLLNVGNITTSGEVDLQSTERYISSEEAFGKYSHFLVDEGDLLMPCSGIPIAEDGLLQTRSAFACANDLPLCMNTSTIRFKSKTKNASLAYLRIWLQSREFRSQITRIVTGSAQKNFGPSHLKQLIITLPPLEEQRRIAAILDKASKTNTLIAEAIRKVADMKDSLFDEMFVADGLHDSWEHVALGDLCDVQGGLQVSSKRSSLPIKVPYLRVANVLRGRLLLDEVKEIKCCQSELERTRLKPGDLLIVEGHGNPSEIGRVAIWAGYPGEIVHQNHLIRARSQNNSLDPNFLCFYLNSRTGRRHLLKRANTTSGLNTISTSVVKSSPIILPPTTLQKQFCNAIKSITRLEANIINKQSLHQKLIASLASELFKK